MASRIENDSGIVSMNWSFLTLIKNNLSNVPCARLSSFDFALETTTGQPASLMKY